MGYSNLAYSFEEDNRYEEQIKQKRRELHAEQKRTSRKSHFVAACYVMLMLLAAVFMIGKNVSEYEGKLEIKRLEKQLAEIQSYTSQKVFEMEENIDLTTVEEAAKTRLGMQRPDKNQMVYVNIKKDDVCELTSDEVEGVKHRVSSAAAGIKQNVFGIFSLK